MEIETVMEVPREEQYQLLNKVVGFVETERQMFLQKMIF